jgi:hypothetical protein
VLAVSRPREKMITTLTVRVDEPLRLRVEEYQRRRESETRAPLSLSIAIRQLVEDGLDAIERGKGTT